MSNKLLLKEMLPFIEAGDDNEVMVFDSTTQYGFRMQALAAALVSWPAAVSATEVGYLNGVTSALQTQLDAKQAVVAGVDATEIGYLNGVTSAIQTQLNALGTTYRTHITAGGTVDAITATLTTARVLAAGDMVTFKAAGNNTGATTLALTGATPATAVAIEKKGAACSGGEIDNNGMYAVIYDGTVWQLVCGD